MENLKTYARKGAEIVENESGRIGYIIAWLMGVPVSVLILVYLIRGH